jgi:hypothetical protein
VSGGEVIRERESIAHTPQPCAQVHAVSFIGAAVLAVATTLNPYVRGSEISLFETTKIGSKPEKLPFLIIDTESIINFLIALIEKSRISEVVFGLNLIRTSTQFSFVEVSDLVSDLVSKTDALFLLSVQLL